MNPQNGMPCAGLGREEQDEDVEILTDADLIEEGEVSSPDRLEGDSCSALFRTKNTNPAN